MPKHKITPAQIRTDHRFMGSIFRNSECETILRNIILLAQSRGSWAPFTWDEYCAICTHKVTSSERDVLRTFTMGGTAHYSSSTHQEPGWLEFHDESWHFTRKMTDMLAARTEWHKPPVTNTPA